MTGVEVTLLQGRANIFFLKKIDISSEENSCHPMITEQVLLHLSWILISPWKDHVSWLLGCGGLIKNWYTFPIELINNINYGRPFVPISLHTL
jgi:hypothetical protein